MGWYLRGKDRDREYLGTNETEALDTLVHDHEMDLEDVLFKALDGDIFHEKEEDQD